jgi:hypothetical protein
MWRAPNRLSCSQYIVIYGKDMTYCVADEYDTARAYTIRDETTRNIVDGVYGCEVDAPSWTIEKIVGNSLLASSGERRATVGESIP